MTISESVIHTLPKDMECRDRKVVEKEIIRLRDSFLLDYNNTNEAF